MKLKSNIVGWNSYILKTRDPERADHRVQSQSELSAALNGSDVQVTLRSRRPSDLGGPEVQQGAGRTKNKCDMCSL
jgi:hypothetical protein